MLTCTSCYNKTNVYTKEKKRISPFYSFLLRLPVHAYGIPHIPSWSFSICYVRPAPWAILRTLDFNMSPRGTMEEWWSRSTQQRIWISDANNNPPAAACRGNQRQLVLPQGDHRGGCCGCSSKRRQWAWTEAAAAADAEVIRASPYDFLESHPTPPLPPSQEPSI